MYHSLLLLAQNETIPSFWHRATFFEALLATAAFGALGVVLLFVGFKVFDWLTPKLDIEKELAEKNMAVAIVVTAIIISLGFIIARTIGG